MTEPTTAAGRRLLGHLSECDTCRPFGDHFNARGLVATIEAEARAYERERLLSEPMMDAVRELVEAARAPLDAQVAELRAALERLAPVGSHLASSVAAYLYGKEER